MTRHREKEQNQIIHNKRYRYAARSRNKGFSTPVPYYGTRNSTGVSCNENVYSFFKNNNYEPRGVLAIAKANGMNRKGFVGDVMTWVLIILVLVPLIFFGYNFLDAAAEASGGEGSEVVQQSLQGSTSSWARGWDIAIMAGLGFLIIGTMITSWMIGTNPMWFWITLIILVFFLLAIVALHNLGNALLDDEQMMLVVEQMPGTAFIVRNILYISVAGAAMVMFSLFAKSRVDG